jgi:hypothetical protein
MSTYLTLAMAKDQAGIPQSDASLDEWVLMVMDQAEAMVLDYLKTTPDTSPLVTGAMYLQFAELWRFRGDDTDGQLPKASMPGALSPQIERMLYRLRDPEIA